MTVKFEDNDKLWRNLIKEMKIWNNSFVKVGVLEGAYPGGLSVALVAFWLENGTKRMVPRPLFRLTFEKNVNKIDAFIIKETNSILIGKSKAVRSLKRVGIWYKGRLQNMFGKSGFAPLKKSTLKLKKGKTTILIDSGQYRASIDFEVNIK